VSAITEVRHRRYVRAVSALRAGLAAGDTEMRARLALVVVHDRLRQHGLQPHELPQALPADLVERPAAGGPDSDYPEVVRRVRAAVQECVPAGARVLLVSRGDGALLQLQARTAEHFPQDENGQWAGFYPADSETAISHLERLRSDGAEFLVFPATAMWWLDYYAGLARHMLTSARVAHHGEECVVFDLRRATEGSTTGS